jgi:hypothetical protein
MQRQQQMACQLPHLLPPSRHQLYQQTLLCSLLPHLQLPLLLLLTLAPLLLPLLLLRPALQTSWECLQQKVSC